MVYIHIPFCHRRCTYCAFYSQTQMGLIDDYLAALDLELKARADGHAVTTLYIGGGTPTALGINGLSRLLNAVASRYDLSDLKECTVECNPEHLTGKFLSELRTLGVVNRLSVGIQSFDDKVLRSVNRVHDSATALLALRHCAETGFDNISVDLIYGLPNQRVDSFVGDLAIVSGMIADGVGIHHLSAYALSVEDGSMLKRQLDEGRVVLPDEDVVSEDYRLLQEWRNAEGMLHYEVSNYCHGGFESKHNSRYWDRTPYCGYGAGAHSFSGRVRRWNVSDIKQYIADMASGGRCYDEELLDGKDAFNETVMTALRTRKGLDSRAVESQYLSHLESGMRRFEEQGWVMKEGNSYKPTEEGMLWADYMAAEMFL
ncbi:MAG: radical SAM family heme chaperone HemW [Bacteroidales bacterium]|nr:radical SAM family heme chaperone HemW [Bacteroidales bacterium]